MQQALEQYQAITMPARNLARRTRVEYSADLGDLVTFLEEEAFISRVGELSLAGLEQYLAELDARGLAGSTRKRKTIAIRSFLTFLYRQDFIATDLAARLIPPFAGSPNPRFLTQSEYQRLLQAARGNARNIPGTQFIPIEKGGHLALMFDINAGSRGKVLKFLELYNRR